MTTTEPATTALDALDLALNDAGPGGMLDRLIAELEDRGEFRALLDAQLLRARHELGLPAVLDGPLSSLPEPARTQYEDRYIAALRSIGHKILASGDLLAAWPYFRVIGEKEPIFQALESYNPADGDERIGHVIDVAFQQGVHPRRGFELILGQFGVCSAISAFEGLPPEEPLRAHCAQLLVRQLHDQITTNLRAEISRRGQPSPPAGATILALITGRPWLFAEDAYHVDVSHLASVVRMSPLLTDLATLDLAIGLTDYGRNLSQLHRHEGEPPFEHLYEDHSVFLRALRGQGVEAAIAHFRSKLPVLGAAGDEEGPSDPQPAQILVRLLVRLGRIDSAIEVAAEHLAGMPESALSCPSLPQLCLQAGRPDRLAQSAREQGDLVQYAAALLAQEKSRCVNI